MSKAKTTKFSPITKCVKFPVTLCGPAGCGFREGDESCIKKTKNVVSDQPKENCSLDPKRNCKHVTKLLPVLKEENMEKRKEYQILSENETNEPNHGIHLDPLSSALLEHSNG